MFCILFHFDFLNMNGLQLPQYPIPKNGGWLIASIGRNENIALYDGRTCKKYFFGNIDTIITGACTSKIIMIPKSQGASTRKIIMNKASTSIL